MNNIETMKLALEALNTPRPFDNYPPLWRAYEKTINEAITALRQAIKQAQQAEPVVWMYQDKSTHEMRFQKHMSEFVDHSKTSEVPLYGEPLANHELQCVCGAVWCGDEMVHLPNKTPPRQPEQPKVRTGDCLLVGICASEGHKIQPPRQPLTDECKKDIRLAIKGYFDDAYVYGDELYSKIIDTLAAHGIKGEA